MGQIAKVFSKSITKEMKFNYYLYLPKDYEKDRLKNWPLILFLHGAGERGNNIELIKKHGLPKILENKSDFPFIVVCPQCVENSWWVKEIENLNYFLDTIIESYNVDVNCIYLTGMSMGGFGAWYLGMANPEKFAAIAPVCGGGMSWNAEALKNVPIWVFHGAKDPTVPLFQSKNMVESLKDCGANVKFTVYPEAEHDCWTETYDNNELYKWFLEHTKKNRN